MELVCIYYQNISLQDKRKERKFTISRLQFENSLKQNFNSNSKYFIKHVSLTRCNHICKTSIIKLKITKASPFGDMRDYILYGMLLVTNM